MAQALTYLYDIYTGFLNMVFNDFELFPNVTVGWIVVVVLVLGLVINSVLNIPRGISYNSPKQSTKVSKRSKP